MPSAGEYMTIHAYDSSGNIKDGYPASAQFASIPAYNKREEYMDSDSSGILGEFKACSHYSRGTQVLNNVERRRTFRDPDDGDYGWRIFQKGIDYFWPVDQLGSVTEPLGKDEYPDLKLVPLYEVGPEWKEVLLPPDLDELRERSLRAMLPLIRPRLSLINFIIELKDIKSVPRTIERMKSVFKPKKGDGRTLRRFFRAAADVYLQKEFNVEPLLRDIVGIKTALSRHYQEVQNLLDRERSPQLRHFEAELGGNYVDREDVLSYHDPQDPVLTRDGENYQTRETRYVRAKFYATIRYSYTVTELERRQARIRALLDALGINFNLAIIWNAIPWSFVLDWVAGVSRFLNDQRVNNIEPVCTIHDYCCSVNVERYIRCFLYLNVNGVVNHAPRAEVPASVIHEIAYKRVVGIPDLFGSIRRSGLSLKEFSLGVALAASRR
jgi:hypothetical protein